MQEFVRHILLAGIVVSVVWLLICVYPLIEGVEHSTLASYPSYYQSLFGAIPEREYTGWLLTRGLLPVGAFWTAAWIFVGLFKDREKREPKP